MREPICEPLVGVHVPGLRTLADWDLQAETPSGEPMKAWVRTAGPPGRHLAGQRGSPKRIVFAKTGRLAAACQDPGGLPTRGVELCEDPFLGQVCDSPATFCCRGHKVCLVSRRLVASWDSLHILFATSRFSAISNFGENALGPGATPTSFLTDARKPFSCNSLPIIHNRCW